MAMRPLILITNDDGIASPGLHAAVRAVADLGDPLIIAPSSQQTGAGRSYLNKTDQTIHTTQIPLNGNEPHHVAYTADVSPAQAVQLGILELADRPVDLCISGINFGENLGSGVTISGTVGAAIEAGCSNIPALAISFETPQEYHLNYSDDVDFSVAAHFTRYFAQEILTKGLPPHVDLLKIDVPATATLQTEWQIAKISRQRYYQAIPKYRRQAGKTTNYEVYIDQDTLEPETDIHTFAVEKLVSVVPMTIDLSAPVDLPEITRFFNMR